MCKLNAVPLQIKFSRRSSFYTLSFLPSFLLHSDFLNSAPFIQRVFPQWRAKILLIQRTSTEYWIPVWSPTEKESPFFHTCDSIATSEECLHITLAQHIFSSSHFLEKLWHASKGEIFILEQLPNIQLQWRRYSTYRLICWLISDHSEAQFASEVICQPTLRGP